MLNFPSTKEFFEKIENEVGKFMDINIIYKKLKDESSLNNLHSNLFEIFEQEHNFTLKGLIEKYPLLFKKKNYF